MAFLPSISTRHLFFKVQPQNRYQPKQPSRPGTSWRRMTLVAGTKSAARAFSNPWHCLRRLQQLWVAMGGLPSTSTQHFCIPSMAPELVRAKKAIKTRDLLAHNDTLCSQKECYKSIPTPLAFLGETPTALGCNVWPSSHNPNPQSGMLGLKVSPQNWSEPKQPSRPGTSWRIMTLVAGKESVARAFTHPWHCRRDCNSCGLQCETFLPTQHSIQFLKVWPQNWSEPKWLPRPGPSWHKMTQVAGTKSAARAFPRPCHCLRKLQQLGVAMSGLCFTSTQQFCPQSMASELVRAKTTNKT